MTDGGLFLLSVELYRITNNFLTACTHAMIESIQPAALITNMKLRLYVLNYHSFHSQPNNHLRPLHTTDETAKIFLKKFSGKVVAHI